SRADGYDQKHGQKGRDSRSNREITDIALRFGRKCGAPRRRGARGAKLLYQRLMAAETRPCLICQTPFAPNKYSPRQKICSNPDKVKDYRKNHLSEYREYMKEYMRRYRERKKTLEPPAGGGTTPAAGA